MKKWFFVTSLILSVLVSSCIPHKDTIYLQNKDTGLNSTRILVETQKPYRIQIYDILSIIVKALDQENVQIINPLGDQRVNIVGEERAYFDGFIVDIHGDIRIPILGKIKVLGYTTEEIQKMIEKKLLDEQFKETANIFVTVKLTGFRYTTMGEIGNGTRTLYQDRVNIFEAIANAGDIPVTGNKKDVMIIRQYPQGQKIHHLDLTNINVMQSPYYYLQPNDLIYVKPLKQKAWGTGTNALQNLTAFLTVLTAITTTIVLLRL